MKNKFIIVVIAFITLFFSQSQVWASSENLKNHTEFNNIQIDKSVFLSNDESPAIIAKRVGDVKEKSSWLIASIFIVGLGQIIMGDFWRGFKFMLNFYGLFILGSLFGVSLSIISYALGFYVLVAGILALILTLLYTTIFYILNIMDAYKMSQEQAGTSKLNEEQISKLEKELKTVMDFATSVKVSDSGAVSVRALAF